jgi:hypothetical protein
MPLNIDLNDDPPEISLFAIDLMPKSNEGMLKDSYGAAIVISCSSRVVFMKTICTVTMFLYH